MHKKGQLTYEYVILLAFISVMVIPAVYYLTVSVENVKDEYALLKLYSYGNDIIENAVIVYYSGLYSKVTLTPNLEGGKFFLDDVYVIQVTDGTDDWYYLAIEATQSGIAEQYLYPSEVPLRTDDCNPSVPGASFPECDLPGTDCTICGLEVSEFIYARFRVETVLESEELIVDLSTVP